MKKKMVLTTACMVLLLIANASVLRPLDEKSVNHSKATESVVLEKTWKFYSAIKQPTAEALADENNYKFGKEAGYLYAMFMTTYVVREEVVPGDPMRRTVIRKPIIYNAVRSIEKQLGKELRSNRITAEQVAADFAQVLKTALSAIDSDSQSFEDALQLNRKDASYLLSVFKQVELTEI